ncbi:hypothetical protein B296_00054905 [Ensete ventricosum]|uniref:Uncharacterized protein n=1 Tax=Ensete ventricosum TaxID=4639 RepID=A0A426X554_ENSVE|nr:hypothetical protein B296_00054905 [Ensete ventricosum]
MGSRPYDRHCCLRAAPCGRYPYWRLLLPAVALASGSPSHGAAPCSLVAGSCHLRPGRGRLPLAVAMWAAGPCGLAAAVRSCGAAATTGDRPLVAGSVMRENRVRSPLFRIIAILD